jgi:hypothetical protein
MTPSVSARWMHGKLLVAQTIAAAISGPSYQIN